MEGIIGKDSSSILTYPDYKKFVNILINSSSHEKDTVNPLSFFEASPSKIEDNINLVKYASSFFMGRAVKIPKFRILDKTIEKFSRFEDFTKVEELSNISLWSLGALRFLSLEKGTRLGKELEIIQTSNPRDGRLDLVILSTENVLIIETKTDLSTALSENRFVSQVSNYTKECQRVIDEYTKQGGPKFKLISLLEIGGEETDLYPVNHPDCTSGKVGKIARIFYDTVVKHDIKFVSANALWALTAYAQVKYKKIDFISLLEKVNDGNFLGLLSGGMVCRDQDKIVVRELGLE